MAAVVGIIAFVLPIVVAVVFVVYGSAIVVVLFVVSGTSASVALFAAGVSMLRLPGSFDLPIAVFARPITGVVKMGFTMRVSARVARAGLTHEIWMRLACMPRGSVCVRTR